MVERTATSRRGLGELLDPQFMARLDALDIASRKILQGKLAGERRSKRRGQSVEFADHRPYVAGDDLRLVDWNVYGRLEQLFLKLFLEEQDLTVHVLLDVSASMDFGTPSKHDTARRIAAALGYVALANNNRLTVSAAGDGLVGQLANLRGRGRLAHLADFLLGLQADGPSRFDATCRAVAAGRAGAGVMIVISDFLYKEGYQQALRRLIGRHYELYLIHVLSPQEIEPDISGDLKLLDMEDGDAAEVTVSSALLEYYRRTLAAYCDELNAFATRRSATYVSTSSADAVEPLVLNYLRRAGLLK